MKKSSIGKGIGCITLLPAAFIGLAGLTDGVGPTGWRGFAEILGWIAICGATAYCLGLLFKPVGWLKAWRYLLGIVTVTGFTFMINWLGLDAPMEVKIAFTSALQIIGLATLIAFVLSIAYFARSRHQKF